MSNIKVCVVGGGNITLNRHIPALLKENINIVGAIGKDKNNLDLIQKKYNVKNIIIIDENLDIERQIKDSKWFINDIDAVVCGLPPNEHYKMAMIFLKLNKHVLMEKPFTITTDEAMEIIKLSKEKKLVVNLVHNFQYADGMIKLENIIKNNELGNIKSILEFQISNRFRRLPKWYNELPLGLFYDEAAHFFYTIFRLFGDIKINNAFCVYNKDENDKTPKIINSNMMTENEIPITLYINFNSPICEWFFIVFGENKIAIYDFFKDILILINNDDLHLSKNILNTALQYFCNFWKGFFINGFKYTFGKLLYGHDIVVKNFIKAIENNQQDYNIYAERGLQVVQAMNKIIEIANKK